MLWNELVVEPDSGTVITARQSVSLECLSEGFVDRDLGDIPLVLGEILRDPDKSPQWILRLQDKLSSGHIQVYSYCQNMVSHGYCYAPSIT